MGKTELSREVRRSRENGQRRSLSHVYLLGVYCAAPSTAKERNLAYLSPIFRSSLYSGLARQACIFSILSQTCTTTRFGGSPSIAITFAPDAAPPAAAARQATRVALFALALPFSCGALAV